LKRVLVRRRQRRRVVWAALAGLVLVATTTISLMWPSQFQDPAARITGWSGGEVRVQGLEASVQVGQRLLPGTVVSIGADSYLALEVSGYDLRLRAGSRVHLREAEVGLLAGDLYASGEPDANGSPELVIVTPHGVIRDIGTQFTVRVEPDQTLATVRRGKLEVLAGGRSLRARAPSEGARQVRIGSADQGVEVTTVPATGSEWRWIYQSGREYVLEGRTAHEFLRWSTDESGLVLDYADQAAEIYARTTTLHGDIISLDPEQAVAPVLATTDLNAERTGQRLRVSLERRD
jgi:ferric-dicitrate binding protein FerR (iron transport regulator)